VTAEGPPVERPSLPDPRVQRGIENWFKETAEDPAQAEKDIGLLAKAFDLVEMEHSVYEVTEKPLSVTA